MKRKLFEDNQVADIKRHLSQRYPSLNIEVPAFLQSLGSVLIKDQFGMIMKLEKGDTFIIAGGENEEDEWIMELTEMMQAGPFDGQFTSFVDGKCYIPCFLHGNVVKHTWTLIQKLLPHKYGRDSGLPIANFKRKIIMYPDPSSIDDPNYYLAIDIYNPAVHTKVAVPIFPEDGDTVQVKGTRNETWYGRCVKWIWRLTL